MNVSVASQLLTTSVATFAIAVVGILIVVVGGNNGIKKKKETTNASAARTIPPDTSKMNPLASNAKMEGTALSSINKGRVVHLSDGTLHSESSVASSEKNEKDLSDFVALLNIKKHGTISNDRDDAALLAAGSPAVAMEDGVLEDTKDEVLEEDSFDDEDYDSNASIQSYETDYEYEDDDAPPPVETESPASINPKKNPSAYDKKVVSMSLRADKETHGGKRRLANDLTRIMMADTKQAGFSLEPTYEDRMETWTIQLLGFDKDSDLHKDMLVLGIAAVELEMTFPEQYPFEPPFVQVVRPRLNGGYIISGAICMELLTKDGWNPVNDIETVIVSIRSHIVMGKARLQAVIGMAQKDYDAKLAEKIANGGSEANGTAKQNSPSTIVPAPASTAPGKYTREQALAGFASLEAIHKKGGWSNRTRKDG